MNKIDIYLEELYFQEGIFDILPKIDVQSFTKKIKSLINPNDPVGSIKKINRLVPSTVKPNLIDKIDTFFTKKYNKFSKMKKLSIEVLKNSLDNVSPTMLSVAGTYLVYSSLFTKKGQEGITPEQNLKSNLKIFVSKARKFGEEYKEEKKSKLRVSDYTDIAVAWVIIVMSTALALSAVSGIVTITKIIAAGLITVPTFSWALIIILLPMLAVAIVAQMIK